MIEVGMLITEKHFPLITVFGSTGLVDFPVEYAMEVHKRFPGLIRRMVHTHPDEFVFLSEEDRTTLKAWTIAMSPYKICMEVICRSYVMPIKTKDKLFRKMYFYMLEPLEDWLAGDRSKPREFKLFQNDLTGCDHPEWVKEIVKLSNL